MPLLPSEMPAPPCGDFVITATQNKRYMPSAADPAYVKLKWIILTYNIKGLELNGQSKLRTFIGNVNALNKPHHIPNKLYALSILQFE